MFLKTIIVIANSYGIGHKASICEDESKSVVGTANSIQNRYRFKYGSVYVEFMKQKDVVC